MGDFKQQLSIRLSERDRLSLTRKRKILSSPQSSEIVVGSKKMLSFCSNDYLGLANHPDVISAFKLGLDRYGAGSGASHLITGHNSAHHELENALAEFTGRSKTLLFSSGYAANVGVLTTLLSKQDEVYQDKLNHISLLEGGIFSGAKFKRFPHLNTSRLNQELENNKSNSKIRKLIVSDGVFSMDGDVAKLSELIEVGAKYRAELMIDDAHGFGCIGKDGGGLCALASEKGYVVNEDNLQILVGTFGKAFGTSGAFVSGCEELIETLIQFCRPYIYTTAMAPAIAVATLRSLSLIQKETWRRERLQYLIKTFRDRSTELGFELTNSETPIQAIIFGDVVSAVNASAALEERGIIVSAIRPPTVPVGSSRLRITFSADHTDAQLTSLLDALEELLPYTNGENLIPTVGKA